jgi:asparagine synthase (glutamine-hydrolysing)
MGRAVERRLRGDVPVVSYLSGGLDSTVVLGLVAKRRAGAVPSFTIGLDRAGPDERSQATESAEALGSRLTTVTMDRDAIAGAYPGADPRRGGPVLDTSCACLLRLAGAVHGQGYKVALTGEGADEALAGYVWFKGQKVRDTVFHRVGGSCPGSSARWSSPRSAGSARSMPMHAIGGARPVQQELYEMISQSRSILYSRGMWDRLDGHDPYTTSTSPTTASGAGIRSTSRSTSATR